MSSTRELWAELGAVEAALRILAKRIGISQSLKTKRHLRQAFSALTEAKVCLEQAHEVYEFQLG